VFLNVGRVGAQPWARSDAEIGRLAQGYNECDAVVKARRERREVEELETLYKLGDLPTVPGQQKQKRRD